MKTSKTGYLKNSPDVNKSQNTILGGDITMRGVEFKVLGTDDRGYTKIMQPGYDYKFPGAKYVTETPIKKTNMESNKQEKKNLLKDNPIASHGSWISKHSIAAGSPLHKGGSGKRTGGEIIRTKKFGVQGGQFTDEGNYIPRTASQKASATEEQLATRKARAKADTRSGAEKKAALEAKRKAKKAADLKSGK
jgi:hypothetical protein